LADLNQATNWPPRGAADEDQRTKRAEGQDRLRHQGQTTSHVVIDVNRMTITASITNEAVDELKLAQGKDAYAVIKASDVMVGID
jgi:molybdopterin-binding protein